MSEAKSDIILHYYQIRGFAQPIRNLLTYLGITYKEHIIHKFEDANSYMKGQSFFQTGYPMIHDNGFIISDLNAILRYIAMKTNRTDLLGATPQIQAKINEIFFKYMMQKGKVIPLLIHGIKEIESKPELKMEIGERVLKKLIQESKYIQGCLIFSRGKGFVMKDITILDFVFYETCFYVVSLYPQAVNNKNFIGFLKFKEHFENQQFYKFYKQELESRPIFFQFEQQGVTKLIEKYWAGDKTKIFYKEPQKQ